MRLVDTASFDGINLKEYLTLSHCWGKPHEEFVLLRKSNLEAFKKSIVLDDLAPNFRHAILTTARLGFRYLWIDSLCIIQGDAKDWATEAPLMGRIYANATCCLSATAASDMGEGFFSAKDPFLQDCVLRTDGDHALVVKSVLSGNDSLSSLFEKYVDGAKITSRGWTFQEKILSKRVLHFCKGFVLFECNTMRASEYDVEGIPYARRTDIQMDGSLHASIMLRRLHKEDVPTKLVTEGKRVQKSRRNLRSQKNPYGGYRMTTVTVMKETVVHNPDFQTYMQKRDALLDVSALNNIRGSFQVMIRSQGMSSNSIERLELHQSWYDLVEQYSARDLTCIDQDRLMAITGVASFIHSQTDWTFVSGLCERLMPFNLLWFRIDSEDTNKVLCSRPVRSFEAPTWSWVSVDGPISHRLKAEPRPEISRSWLMTRILQKKLQIEVFESTWHEENIKVLIDEKSTRIDEIDLPLTEETCGKTSSRSTKRKLTVYPRYPLIDLSKANKISVHKIFDVKVNPTDRPLYGLILLEFCNAHVQPLKSKIQLHGIIIVAMSEEHLYERVGYFWTTDEEVIKSVEIISEGLQYISLQ